MIVFVSGLSRFSIYCYFLNFCCVGFFLVASTAWYVLFNAHKKPESKYIGSFLAGLNCNYSALIELTKITLLFM